MLQLNLLKDYLLLTYCRLPNAKGLLLKFGRSDSILGRLYLVPVDSAAVRLVGSFLGEICGDKDKWTPVKHTPIDYVTIANAKCCRFQILNSLSIEVFFPMSPNTLVASEFGCANGVFRELLTVAPLLLTSWRLISLFMYG